MTESPQLSSNMSESNSQPSPSSDSSQEDQGQKGSKPKKAVQPNRNQKPSSSETGPYGITRSLADALFNTKDRPFVVDLERLLVHFISSNVNLYRLSPMNLYCRLLAHQIAEYHGLKHILANDRESVVVFKTFTPPGQLGESVTEQKPLLADLAIPNGTLTEKWTAKGPYQGYKPHNRHHQRRREDKKGSDSDSETSSAELPERDGKQKHRKLYRHKKYGGPPGPASPGVLPGAMPGVIPGGAGLPAGVAAPYAMPYPMAPYGFIPQRPIPMPIPMLSQFAYPPGAPMMYGLPKMYPAMGFVPFYGYEGPPMEDPSDSQDKDHEENTDE